MTERPNLVAGDEDGTPLEDQDHLVNGRVPGKGSGLWTEDGDGAVTPSDGQPLSIEEVLTRRNPWRNLNGNPYDHYSRGGNANGQIDSRILTFEDGSAWDWSNYSTSTVFRGSQAPYFNSSTFNIGTDFASAVDLTLKDGNILHPSIAIYADPDEVSGQVEVGTWFRDSADNDADAGGYHHKLPDRRPTTWYRADMPIRIPDTAYDHSDVVRLMVRTDNQTGFYLDDLRFVPGRSRGGAFVFQFDGGYQSVYDNAYPILEKYGMVGSIALSETFFDEPDKYMSESQLRELYEAGWDIGVHSGNEFGKLYGVSYEDQRDHLLQRKRDVQALGVGEPTFMIPLANKYDENTIKASSEIFPVFYGGDPGVKRCHSLPKGSTYVSSRGRVAGTTDEVGYAERGNTVCTMYWHDITSDGEITPSNFESLVQQVDTADIEAITPTRFARERYGQ